MDQFSYNKNFEKLKSASDPSLTSEPDNSIDFGPVFNSGGNDPKLFAIFDEPEHALNNLNTFRTPDQYIPFNDLAFQEPVIKKDDSESYCAVTKSNATIDDKDLLLTDFDNSSSSPNSQSSKIPKCSSIPTTKSELQCSLLDNLTFEEMMAAGVLAQSTPPPSSNLLFDCQTESADPSAYPVSRVSNSGFLIKSPTTQKRSPRKNYAGEYAFKIQKPRHFQNTSSLQSFINSYNMELNYILLSEKTGKLAQDQKSTEKVGNSTEQNGNNASASHTVMSTQLFPSNNLPLQSMSCQGLPPIALDSEPITQVNSAEGMTSNGSQNQAMESEIYRDYNTICDSMTTDELQEAKAPKINTGKLPRSRRTKCLKKDSTVSLEEKLEYFGRIIQSARLNSLRGIFLRDHAASELAIDKDDYDTLELDLTNFDFIIQTLQTMMQSHPESFRTIWKIFRQQYDQQIFLTFQLSDEYSTVHENEMEISIFTLIVPGHTPKHLMTGCQYLQLVNFILGKEYNHLINDNLAETTVGSDGKMISTQKHHASRVRSHVKKYLKRHVVKDIRRYTEEERGNPSEFDYQMTLHNLVMSCTVKKPFESKVSVALMELFNVRDALIKQAEFFVFKRI